MKRRMREPVPVCLAVAMSLAAIPGRAAEFHAVSTNFGNAPRASAHLDV